MFKQISTACGGKVETGGGGYNLCLDIIIDGHSCERYKYLYIYAAVSNGKNRSLGDFP
jgi:hypothetical protein